MNSYSKILWVFILSLSIVSCNTSKDSLGEDVLIYKSTISEALNWLEETFKFEAKRLVYVQETNSDIKSVGIKKLIEKYPSFRPQELKLLRLLEKAQFVESPDFLENTASGYMISLSSNSLSERELSGIDGQINLSRVAILEGESIACYYLAIQCGSNCGVGCIVFAKKDREKWIKDKVIPIWN